VAAYVPVSPLVTRKALADWIYTNKVLPLLDVENYIDFLILQLMACETDFHAANYKSYRQNAGTNLEAKKFRFLTHDHERGFRACANRVSEVINVWPLNGKESTPLPNTPEGERQRQQFGGYIAHKLKAHDAFVASFKQRVTLHTSLNGSVRGFFYRPPTGGEGSLAKTLFTTKTNAFIAKALYAESARWGDAAADSGLPNYSKTTAYTLSEPSYLPTQTSRGDYQRTINYIQDVVLSNGSSSSIRYIHNDLFKEGLANAAPAP
jgi:hypothetical protein